VGGLNVSKRASLLRPKNVIALIYTCKLLAEIMQRESISWLKKGQIYKMSSCQNVIGMPQHFEICPKNDFECQQALVKSEPPNAHFSNVHI